MATLTSQTAVVGQVLHYGVSYEPALISLQVLGDGSIGQLVSEASERCINTDNGMTDQAGDGCLWYAETPSDCGFFDWSMFVASDLCCACGGGYIPPTVEADQPMTDFELQMLMLQNTQRSEEDEKWLEEQATAKALAESIANDEDAALIAAEREAARQEWLAQLELACADETEA